MSEFCTKQEAAEILKLPTRKSAVKIMRIARIRCKKVTELRDNESISFFGYEREGIEELAKQRLPRKILSLKRKILE